MADIVIEKSGETELKHLFKISMDDTGRYFAIREESPMFCFSGDSIAEVVLKVEEALDFYKRSNRKRYGYE